MRKKEWRNLMWPLLDVTYIVSQRRPVAASHMPSSFKRRFSRPVPSLELRKRTHIVIGKGFCTFGENGFCCIHYPYWFNGCTHKKVIRSWYRTTSATKKRNLPKAWMKDV
nr:hypothetical protein [Tanacetum cinerariifolium]